MATIYFSGSISGGRDDVHLYRRIVAALEEAGHRVLAGSVTATETGAGGEALDAETIFKRDLAWIEESDLLVAEVSMPSTGVGYEIAVARYHYDVPVICLWRPGRTQRCTAMIDGDERITLLTYTDESTGTMLARLADAVNRVRPATV